MKKFKKIFLFIGLIFFVFLIYQVGIQSIADSLLTVGWNFLVIFSVWLGNYIVQNFAWAIEMRKTFSNIGFFSLMKARIAGEAMNGLIPLGNFGGEPVKAYLLSHKADRTEIVASLILDKTIFGFGSLLYIFVGLILTIFALGAFEMKYKILMFVFLALLVYGLIWFVRKKTFFFRFCDRLRRWGIATRFFEEKMEKIQKMDDRIASFYRKNKRRFVASLLLHFTAKVVNAVEFYLVFLYLGFDLTFVHAVCINALSLIINTIFLFVPGHWGVAEGGQAFIFLTLGLKPADGIAVGVVRRVRHIFYTLLGLCIFYFSGTGMKAQDLKQIDKSDTDRAEKGINI